ncbi:allantoinase PuuE [Cohaesibacter gelatinilyticus]|uniref:Chitooligosaccharide deacetylase n=1 Tax=Cohaesibacter gelatinilyticus TaxID=372072 RepID=A0A285NCQ5_9HYPH|nr:allantoinase PuuE [Cohaesibacter gelatinilyticus]SNZ06683.1 OHCU decarboxylase [Cohaesibacter gelatinilyticus]
MTRYSRDMRGYGQARPAVHWPNGAKIAVQFVLNYEEGGENCLLHGDEASEAFLSEIVGAAPWSGQRHWNMESIYEYGARSGFWRLHDVFRSADIPLTIFGVATALARNPEQVQAMLEADWEIASHGLKWIDYKDFTVEDEATHMREAIRLHAEVTGEKPKGWYCGRCSASTVNLASDIGDFDYISDSYADDLPYWRRHYTGKDQLIVPYTLDCNDMRFATNQGFNSGDQFYAYLKDSFDCLYEEGNQGQPKMMSIGLHCRLVGRPGRIQALKRFIDYAQSHDDVWFARRIDVAHHWKEHHSPQWSALQPSGMEKADFLKQFGDIFEHSSFIAERAFDLELGPAHDSPVGIHNALCRIFRSASKEERMGILKAHPDLAGKLAAAKQLTEASNQEQASAGLDILSDEERTHFTDLNQRYVEKHDFPFIIAVRDHNKASILSAFERRIENDSEIEFSEACRQVERIAWHRLHALWDQEDG